MPPTRKTEGEKEEESKQPPTRRRSATHPPITMATIGVAAIAAHGTTG